LRGVLQAVVNAVMGMQAVRTGVRVPHGVPRSSMAAARADSAERHDAETSRSDEQARAVEIQSDHTDS